MSAQLKDSDSLESSDRHPPFADRFGVPMAEVVESYKPEALAKLRPHDRPAAGHRQERIAIAAYHLSEKHGFDPAYDLENWLRAQADIDTQR